MADLRRLNGMPLDGSTLPEPAATQEWIRARFGAGSSSRRQAAPDEDTSPLGRRLSRANDRLLRRDPETGHMLTHLFDVSERGQAEIPGWVMDAWRDNKDWDRDDMIRFLDAQKDRLP